MVSILTPAALRPKAILIETGCVFQPATERGSVPGWNAGEKKLRLPQRKPSWSSSPARAGPAKELKLKALEDLGYYSVDNLPIDLILKLAQLTQGRAHYPVERR